MSLFAFICTIDDAKLDLLGRLRADHYGFLIRERGRIRFGGPARVVEGGRPEIMIIIADMEDGDAASGWIAAEPYNANGGFKSVVVRPWSQVLPEIEPGDLERTQRGEHAKPGDGR